MSSSTKTAVLWLLLVASGCVSQSVVSPNVCPHRGGALRYVNVFDGPPEQLATLVPDVSGEQAGHWKVGYVYDAGRILTVRCKYAGGKQVDVPLPRRVERCNYTADRAQSLKVACR